MTQQMEMHLYRVEDYIQAFELLGVKNPEQRGRTLYRYMNVLSDLDLTPHAALAKAFDAWARTNGEVAYPAHAMAEKMNTALRTVLSPVTPPALTELF